MPEFAHAEAQDTQRARAPLPVQEEGDEHDLLKLQRLVGNSAVSFLVQRQDDPAAPAPTDASAPGGGGAAPAAAAAPAEMQQQAIFKNGSINITMQGGKLLDATAQIGGSGGQTG